MGPFLDVASDEDGGRTVVRPIVCSVFHSKVVREGILYADESVPPWFVSRMNIFCLCNDMIQEFMTPNTSLYPGTLLELNKKLAFRVAHKRCREAQ